MVRKNINDIIKSELVARTNNAKIRQEYRDTALLPVIGGKTLFTTVYEIDTIVYLTVNGATQTLGVDYTTDGKFEISMNSGTFLPGTIIQVGYMYKKAMSSVKLPPVITFFTVSAASGGPAMLSFEFSILQNDGTDIYWEILRDGDASKVVSAGTALTSTSLTIENEITTEDFLNMPGEHVPYTMIVTYNINGASAGLVNQKVMDNVKYIIDIVEPITGTVALSSSGTSTAGVVNFNAGYSLIIPVNSVPNFDWKFVRVGKDSADVAPPLASGTQASVIPAGTFAIADSAAVGESSSMVFELRVREDGVNWRVVDRKIYTIGVPKPLVVGYGGLMPSEVFCVNPAVSPDVRIDTWGKYQAANSETFLDKTKSLSASAMDGATNFGQFAIQVTSAQYAYYYFVEIPVVNTGNVDGDVEIIASVGKVTPDGYDKILSTDGKTVVYVIVETSPTPSPKPGSTAVGMQYKFLKIDK